MVNRNKYHSFINPFIWDIRFSIFWVNVSVKQISLKIWMHNILSCHKVFANPYNSPFPPHHSNQKLHNTWSSFSDEAKWFLERLSEAGQRQSTCWKRWLIDKKVEPRRTFNPLTHNNAPTWESNQSCYVNYVNLSIASSLNIIKFRLYHWTVFRNELQKLKLLCIKL